jgi:hypothetical protein
MRSLLGSVRTRAGTEPTLAWRTPCSGIKESSLLNRVRSGTDMRGGDAVLGAHVAPAIHESGPPSFFFIIALEPVVE